MTRSDPSYRQRVTPQATHSTDRTRRDQKREAWPLERMKRDWRMSEDEVVACRKAAQWVRPTGQTQPKSPLAVLVGTLYGCEPAEMDRQQSRRTDKLIKAVHRMAQSEGKTEAEVTVAEKTCSMCASVKPPDAFHKKQANADGLEHRCKACKREASRAWHDGEAA